MPLHVAACEPCCGRLQEPILQSKQPSSPNAGRQASPGLRSLPLPATLNRPLLPRPPLHSVLPCRPKPLSCLPPSAGRCCHTLRCTLCCPACRPQPLQMPCGRAHHPCSPLVKAPEEEGVVYGGPGAANGWEDPTEGDCLAGLVALHHHRWHLGDHWGQRPQQAGPLRVGVGGMWVREPGQDIG